MKGLTPELLERYDRPGPRYTSYPTADKFAAGDWQDEWREALAGADLRSLSMYMHVPFCATIWNL